ncbi:hypothetical protein AWZ03_012771 [Drosophila navojoa]|uniref:Uncharacterized protein n=1 Tax=Drosophila navojoa TaxID=7232 RepID=A0A484AW29_DRONA|nr:hypothetical protein AWZ03_012771 [Drosophila navojoa]
MRSTSHTNCIIQTLHKQRLTMMIELMQQELVTRESAAAAAKDVKCIYNCSCFCCRQGCCMVVCSCCTCNTFSCTSYNNRNSSSNISLYRGVSLHPIVVVSTACQSIVAALTLIIGYLTLFKVSYRALWSKAPTNPAAGSATTSNCTSTSSNSNNADSKLKEQYGHGHASYDITNDQQLKTNNLCKMFFNNRKRQRSRRRRRRRRRRRYNNNNSSRQTGSCKQQQYHDSSSDATCLSIAVWTTIGQDEVDSSSNSKSKPYRAHAVGTAYAPTTTILSRWPSMNCSNSNSNSKAKRNRANLLWLLIGIFWLEVKLINCNSIASSNGYVSSIVAQKGCTLCQLEEGIFYSDKREFDELMFKLYTIDCKNQTVSLPHNTLRYKVQKSPFLTHSLSAFHLRKMSYHA